jgi:hypothetical protein
MLCYLRSLHTYTFAIHLDAFVSLAVRCSKERVTVTPVDDIRRDGSYKKGEGRVKAEARRQEFARSSSLRTRSLETSRTTAHPGALFPDLPLPENFQIETPHPRGCLRLCSISPRTYRAHQTEAGKIHPSFLSSSRHWARESSEEKGTEKPGSGESVYSGKARQSRAAGSRKA